MPNFKTVREARVLQALEPIELTEGVELKKLLIDISRSHRLPKNDIYFTIKREPSLQIEDRKGVPVVVRGTHPKVQRWRP